MQFTYMFLPVIPKGFSGQHRDADAGLRDVPQPSSASLREDEDGGSPCPEDSDCFDARPDAAETEEVINKFISGVESQEQYCLTACIRC